MLLFSFQIRPPTIIHIRLESCQKCELFISPHRRRRWLPVVEIPGSKSAVVDVHDVG